MRYDPSPPIRGAISRPFRAGDEGEEMKGGEARLWQRMRAGIVDQCFVQRIENMVGEGVPDVVLHSRCDGKEAWCELKYRPEAPARTTTPIFKGDHGLRPEQVSWIHGRAAVGARIYIIGQCDNSLWLIHGRHARELEAMTITDLMLVADFLGAAKRTDWNGLLEVVFK